MRAQDFPVAGLVISQTTVNQGGIPVAEGMLVLSGPPGGTSLAMKSVPASIVATVRNEKDTIVDFVEYDFDGGEIDHSGNSLPVNR